VEIDPVSSFHRLDLVERGAVHEKRGVATVAQISRSIAEREVRVIQAKLGLPPEACHVESTRNSVGPGNEAHVEIVSEHITEVFTAFGERGVSAEKVGASAAAEAVEYLEADVPVGRHLADQLLVPMSVGSGGMFRTLAPSGHTETQISLVREFLGVDVVATQLDGSRWTIKVGV
jgi:RNA 3'-terminal phosphate cyclase (ATP)